MLRELIDERAVELGTQADGKDKILSKAAKLLSAASGLEAKTIQTRLIDREKLGSTGIGEGIAIPHATDDSLGRFYLALITVPNGVEFDSIDGKPVKVIFAMIGPSSQRSTHVRILAALSRLARNRGFLGTLLNCVDTNGVRDLLSEGDAEDGEVAPKDKSLFLALIQKEEYLEPVLEVLATVADQGIAVMEGHGAGRYLHALPLFSLFWTDEARNDDVKTVMAVIDRHTGNDTIRRIASSVANPRKDKGLLLAIQDLSLVTGSLDL